jgi:uncharacterized membrane protein
MSFADHAILWLHVTAAVFTIGPGTAAVMSTPRFIRNRNANVVRYLFRTTRLYSLLSLLVLIFGLILTAMTHKFSQWWISTSLTLFVVAFVLLFLVVRDQGKALTALEAADQSGAGNGAMVPSDGEATDRPAAQEAAQAEGGTIPAAQPTTAPGQDLRTAAVERGRIASIGGLTVLIWLVILVLMVWH